MCLKRLLTILLLFSFCVCSFTAQSAQENLTKIEDYVIAIENDASKQKEYVMNLEMSLEESERLLAESQKQQTELLQTQEMLQKQLKSYEVKSRNWKIVAGVTVSVSIISIGTIFLILNK